MAVHKQFQMQNPDFQSSRTDGYSWMAANTWPQFPPWQNFSTQVTMEQAQQQAQENNNTSLD